MSVSLFQLYLLLIAVFCTLNGRHIRPKVRKAVCDYICTATWQAKHRQKREFQNISSVTTQDYYFLLVPFFFFMENVNQKRQVHEVYYICKSQFSPKTYMYLCVGGIDFSSFYDFSIGVRNFSENVVLFLFFILYQKIRVNKGNLRFLSIIDFE